MVKSLKSAGFWAYKIADSPASWTASVTRFTPEKPADIIACTKSGRFMLIESKQFKKWQGFYQTAMRDNQMKALDDTTAMGGKGYVFVNIRIAKEKAKGIALENWVVIFSWERFGQRIRNEGFTIKEMKEKSFGIWIKGSKGEFDLTDWLP